MKIPENQNPYRVIVNGVETIYTPGAEATVPDAVAEMIEADKNYPAPAPAPEPIIPIEKELPASSAADAGKVLKVGEDGTPEWGSGGSANAALVVGSTLDGSTTTLNKTWQEIFAGNYVAVRHGDGTQKFITNIAAGKTSFYVTAGETTYECAEETDYPSYTGK